MGKGNIYIIPVDRYESFCAPFCTEKWESGEARKMDIPFVDEGGFNSGLGEEEFRGRQMGEGLRL